MKYLINCFFLNAIKVLNRSGRGLILKKRIFSSQRILERNFKINSNFSFVQVGANDGVSFDFLYEFVIKRKSVGIVIEPIKEYFNELLKNYKDLPEIIKVNKAIHPVDKEVVIYRISQDAISKYPSWVKGIASIDAEHHKKTNINSADIIKETVQAETLMKTIRDNFRNYKIDYFQVDTEGFDFEVIKMVDFTKFSPKIIKYEFVNLNETEQKQLRALLKGQGYYLFNEFGDTIGVNLHKINIM